MVKLLWPWNKKETCSKEQVFFMGFELYEYQKVICFFKIYQFLVYLVKRNAMAKNTSILLGDYFENFVNEEIASGRYSSVSEVVRSALRLLEVEEQKIKKLRSEIELGEASEMIADFDAEAHLAQLQKKLQ
ncbi:MAG: type II toxin-antitoxin system ParD family antitoxin [Flavobacterium sp.]|jgi:antitoxin ParD1/3/4|uniref:type II toxin-antitoxin system ParD family antitoxin n=2 Tax=Flavobacterium sp. TaxID=239 RepID=UPI00338FFEC0